MTSQPNPNDISENPDDQAFEQMRDELFARARKYGEVLEEIQPQGPFVPIGEILDHEVIMISVRFSETKKGLAAFPVLFNSAGELFHTYTASKVVVPKLQAIVEHMPIRLVFVQKEGGNFGKFYDLE